MLGLGVGLGLGIGLGLALALGLGLGLGLTRLEGVGQQPPERLGVAELGERPKPQG